jgi:DNA-binding response OmpR family regulator
LVGGFAMRVLVVEDDRALGQFLQNGLRLEGHSVQWAEDGPTALRLVAEQAPDLMVLDLGLPGCNGMSVLETMRGQEGATAILVLTGYSQVQERVDCLDNGADDLMLKPFSFHELMARCRALLRRRGRSGDSVLRFGALEMDRLQRKVRYGGHAVELTGKEYQVLEMMLRHQGQCCSRAALLQEIWSGAPEGGSNIVDVYITYLRRKLALAQPDDQMFGSAIETVRGAGYRLRRDRRTLNNPGMVRVEGNQPLEVARGA